MPMQDPQRDPTPTSRLEASSPRRRRDHDPDPAPLLPALAVDHRGWVCIWTRVDSTRGRARRSSASTTASTRRRRPRTRLDDPRRTPLRPDRRGRRPPPCAWIDRHVDNAERGQAAANFVEIVQRRAQTRSDLDEQIAREMDNLTCALDAVLNGHPVPTDTTNGAALAPTDENTTSDTNQAFTELANLVGTVQNARPFENAYTCDDDPPTHSTSRSADE